MLCWQLWTGGRLCENIFFLTLRQRAWKMMTNGQAKARLAVYHPLAMQKHTCVKKVHCSYTWPGHFGYFLRRVYGWAFSFSSYVVFFRFTLEMSLGDIARSFGALGTSVVCDNVSPLLVVCIRYRKEARCYKAPELFNSWTTCCVRTRAVIERGVSL